MPLILISGYPSSGKTYRAKQIVSYFESRKQGPTSSISSLPESGPINPRIAHLSIVYISDDTLGIPRSAYDEAQTEKDARAALSSVIKRALGKDVLVVADAMNYIKGFRYQLYCEAKALGTPSCVVHVATSPSQAESLHNIRFQTSNSSEPATTSTVNPDPTEAPLSSATTTTTITHPLQPPSYTPTTFTNLLTRYEEPSPSARWDSPLFVVPFTDASPPNEAIFAALFGVPGKDAPTIRPNIATVISPASAPDALYTLEKTTAVVVGAVQAYVRDYGAEGDGRVRVPGSSSTQGHGEALEVVLPAGAAGSGVGTGQLQRLRRQFVGLYRARGAGMGAGLTSGGGGASEGESAEDRVRQQFVAFLNAAFAGAEEDDDG